MTEVFIYDALRTSLGKGNKQGALFEVRPIDLLGKCLQALKNRHDLATQLVDDLIIGCVVPIGGQADNLAKTALLHAGWSPTVPGMQINRFQASGLVAVGLAAAKIKSGWQSLIIAGGIESMSRIRRSEHRGAISSDPDIMNKIGFIPAGVAADLIATIEKFDKVKLDDFALKSIEKAAAAQTKLYFQKSIVPIYDQNKIAILTEDETISREVDITILQESQPIYPQVDRFGFGAIALQKYPLVEQIIPVHSRANRAAGADSAALIFLGNKATGEMLNLTARAKIVGITTTSTDLTITHRGGIEAAKKVLEKARLSAKDIDLWYVNEAFAAPALLFQQTFNVADECFNPCGGNIAFGDSLGANGSVLLGMLLDELERQQLKKGLIAISAEGGIGTSMIIETV
ncbi:MAG: acetyl-CoA C-acyltransferase [Bacteroidota bacterium]